MPSTYESRVSSTACLPVDIWTNIAGSMSTREWARVSGICRTTFAVRLTNVKIPVEGITLGGDFIDRNIVFHEAGTHASVRVSSLPQGK